MPPKVKGGQILNDVGRTILKYIIDRCKITGFWGRCYSKWKEHRSPIPGSNHVFYDGGEDLVVVWQENKTGPIKTATFVRAKQPGPLETEIREVLARGGHDIAEE